jgi:uncharacterized membrane protein YeaQ/YmgE (transglycosylase-associated protein family)
MSWIAWVVLGGLAGWIASTLTRNNNRMGIFWNVIVGITGALAGSWILGSLDVTESISFSFMAFLVSLGAAVMSLFLFSLVYGRGRS